MISRCVFFSEYSLLVLKVEQDWNVCEMFALKVRIMLRTLLLLLLRLLWEREECNNQTCSLNLILSYYHVTNQKFLFNSTDKVGFLGHFKLSRHTSSSGISSIPFGKGNTNLICYWKISVILISGDKMSKFEE